MQRTESTGLESMGAARAARVPLHPALADFVEAIVCEAPRSTSVDSPPPYGVLPAPYPVLGFQYYGRLSVVGESGEEALALGGISGVQSTIKYYRATADTGTVLVTFKPYGAFMVLRTAMDELAQAHLSLADLLPQSEVERVLEQVIAARDESGHAQVVQSWLLHRLAQAPQAPHPSVQAAVERLLTSRGTAQVDHLANEVALSRRQLERLFKLHIGVGPKEVASLMRFAWTVQQVGQQRSWAELATEAGYADQAHLIRSFAARVGMPPAAYTSRTRTTGP